MSVLNRKVLVLNRQRHAIRIVTLRRAIILASSDYANGNPKAIIIDDETYQEFTWDEWAELPPLEDQEGIKCYNRTIRVPKVIVLTRYDKLPLKKTQYSKRAVYKRDDNQCQYCGSKPGIDHIDIDHVNPKSRGGISSWDNCVVSCIKCNKKKRNRTPSEAGMKLLKKPEKPKVNFFLSDIVETSWNQFIQQGSIPVEIDV